MSPRPDAAQVEAARKLEVHRRVREIEAEILGRTPENNPEPSLDRVAECMSLLGDPQHNFPMIHLTGTNGKTTTTRIIERVLREMGLSTGRFTSPHLHDMRERISLNGNPIEPERLIDVYDDVLPFIEMVDQRSQAEGGPRMTYFEVMVVLAYAAFSDAPVDVAIVEVGLGGVWDATNVADGKVAVVTPISIDHQRLLGNTVEDIAGEKRGIIKPDAIAVIGRQVPEADEILRQYAQEVGARLEREDYSFGVTERDAAVGGQQITVRGLAGEYADLFLPLFGEHQAHNAAMAIAAVEAFVGGGEQPLDRDVLQTALAEVTSPGRLEIVRRSPTVVVDAAHNEGGVEALRAALNDSFTFTRLIGLIAIMGDKDAETMLEALEPVLDEVVVTRNSSPRSMNVAELGELATEVFGADRVHVEPHLVEAIDKAAALADEQGGVGGGVLATGSVVTAADVRAALGVTTT